MGCEGERQLDPGHLRLWVLQVQYTYAGCSHMHKLRRGHACVHTCVCMCFYIFTHVLIYILHHGKARLWPQSEITNPERRSSGKRQSVLCQGSGGLSALDCQVGMQAGHGAKFREPPCL